MTKVFALHLVGALAPAALYAVETTPLIDVTWWDGTPNPGSMLQGKKVPGPAGSTELFFEGVGKPGQANPPIKVRLGKALFSPQLSLRPDPVTAEHLCKALGYATGVRARTAPVRSLPFAMTWSSPNVLKQVRYDLGAAKFNVVFSDIKTGSADYLASVRCLTGGSKADSPSTPQRR